MQELKNMNLDDKNLRTHRHLTNFPEKFHQTLKKFTSKKPMPKIFITTISFHPKPKIFLQNKHTQTQPIRLTITTNPTNIINFLEQSSTFSPENQDFLSNQTLK